MVACDHLTDAVGKFAHLHSILCGKTYEMNDVAIIVHPLHHADRSKNDFFGTLSRSECTRTEVHTHKTVVGGVYAYTAANRISAFGEEILVHSLAYNADLTLQFHIHGIDVSSIFDLRHTYMPVIMVCAIYGGRELVGSAYCQSRTRIVLGSDNVQFGYHIAQAHHVVVVHIPLPAFGKPLVHLGGG